MRKKTIAKSQITAHIAEKNGLTKETASQVLDDWPAIAYKEAKRNGEFTLPGLLKTLVIMFGLFLLAACDSDGGSEAGFLVIDQPSEFELNFAEKRDFYVIGSFPDDVTAPGDIMIQLFAGTDTTGMPIREIRSDVDTVTCTTPLSSIDQDYPNGDNFGIVMVPDLVMVPGGMLDPNNKVVVTDTYYAGVILGGATKDFDTTYTDSSGNTLIDLTEGTYTIVVTGLSCQLSGQTASKQITFGLTHASLGRFSPESTLEKLIAFSRMNNYRAYLDLFPGFFLREGKLYEIKKRWIPNNSIEVANDLSGTLIDTVAVAKNDILIYNVRDSSATNAVEIGSLVHNSLVESANTVFHYYDIGEPTITYVNEESSLVTLDGEYATFPDNVPLVLPRAEIEPQSEETEDNIYSTFDKTPKMLDLDLSDGIAIDANDEFAVFGVVRPIPATTSPGGYDHEYVLDNRIGSIRYAIMNADGGVVDTTIREINLGRLYDESDPTRISESIYEFKHEFTISAGAGTYAVELVGLDEFGSEVEGTAQGFVVEVSE